MPRPGSSPAARAASPVRPAGTRVVIDLRPLQEPERTPITAAYLDRLMHAFAARPLEHESFVAVLRTMREDPSDALEAAGLPMAGRRRVPPTARVFRSAGLTLDSFLLRGAEVGTTWRAMESGAAGAIYHTAGGAAPLASGLPVVATLLDLAPWELPEVYAASPAARFGHRLRARVLHDAVRLIVCSRATAESARRLLRIPAERIAVVPLAPDEAFQPAAASADRVQALRARLALPERYLVFAGRYDARKDLGTLFRALGALRDEEPVRGTEAWPPVLVLAGALGSDESDSVGLARAAARHGVGDLVHQAPRLGPAELATLEGGARAVVFPAVSEGTGLVVQEALAVGTPVVASRVGPLPELVGKAGIVVEARDPDRLAAALRVMWADERVRGPIARAAQTRAHGPRRSWADVAEETRAVYAAAAAEVPSGGPATGS